MASELVDRVARAAERWHFDVTVPASRFTDVHVHMQLTGTRCDVAFLDRVWNINIGRIQTQLRLPKHI